MFSHTPPLPQIRVKTKKPRLEAGLIFMYLFVITQDFPLQALMDDFHKSSGYRCVSSQ